MSIMERSRSLARRLSRLRNRIEQGQGFRLREIKDIRRVNVEMITDWRSAKSSIPDDTWFSVIEVLIDSVNRINAIYLDVVTRGRGRITEDTLLYKDTSQVSDYGFLDIERNAVFGDSREYDGAQGSRTDEYRYVATYKYVVEYGDTLQSIAKNNMRNEDNWRILAQVNDITSITDLEPGMELNIPLVERDDIGLSRFIISESRELTVRSILGTDIAVDPVNGVVIDDKGNAQTISGRENIQQALSHRLNTQLGSVLQLSDSYGLPFVIGKAGVGVAVRYIRIAVRTTLARDPRVSQVGSVSVSVEGDVIRISAEIVLLRNSNITVQTSIGG